MARRRARGSPLADRTPSPATRAAHPSIPSPYHDQPPSAPIACRLAGDSRRAGESERGRSVNGSTVKKRSFTWQLVKRLIVTPVISIMEPLLARAEITAVLTGISWPRRPSATGSLRPPTAIRGRAQRRHRTSTSSRSMAPPSSAAPRLRTRMGNRASTHSSSSSGRSAPAHPI
jgi:hypothetical protein